MQTNFIFNDWFNIITPNNRDFILYVNLYLIGQFDNEVVMFERIQSISIVISRYRD